MNRGYISQKDQMINVNAKIKKDKENYNVDVSPTGFLLDMIGDKKNVRIKLKLKIMKHFILCQNLSFFP